MLAERIVRCVRLGTMVGSGHSLDVAREQFLEISVRENVVLAEPRGVGVTSLEVVDGE
jgi:hypothetical protein